MKRDGKISWLRFQKTGTSGIASALRMFDFGKFLRARGNEPLLDNELIVVSFPKSGRTWVRVMLDQLAIAAVYTHDGTAHVGALHFDSLSPAGAMFGTKRVVFLLRDPRDTAVSGYFQTVKRRDQAYDGGIAAFIRDPFHGVEKIIRFNLAWLEKGPNLRGFIPVAYEELRANPVNTLKRISNFACTALSDEEIAKAVADNTFEKMQQRERSGYYVKRYGDVLSPRDPGDAESYKVRKGKVGGFIDYFSEDDEQYCSELLAHFRYFARVGGVLGKYWRPAASRPPLEAIPPGT